MDKLGEEIVAGAFLGLGIISVKTQQLEVVSAILKGDVFAVLPTGFGKSACFQCLPLLFDKLLPDQDPAIVVVVAPVTAIIKDQVS